jgi:hypothetical protein
VLLSYKKRSNKTSGKRKITKTNEYLKIAEKLIKENNGTIPKHKWLKNNGYYKFYQWMKTHKELINNMMSKTIEIEEFQIVVKINNGKGTITSNMKQKEKEIQNMNMYNDTTEIIESIILAHAMNGIDITTEAYRKGIRKAYETCAHMIF